MKTRILFLLTTLFISMSLFGAPPPEDEVIILAGSTYNNNITTNTADITVLDGAHVKGHLETVSGDIYLENGSRVKSITTQSGDVFGEQGVTVDQNIETVSGSVTIKINSTINGEVETESGDIRITGSYLKKNIKTRHGDIVLKDNTYVKKDIVILDRGQGSDLSPLDIYLGTGVTVHGDVEAEDEDDLVVLEMFGGEVDGDIDEIEVIGDSDDDEDDDEDDGDDEDEDDGECGGREEWSKSVNYQSNDEVHKDGTAYQAKKNSKGKDPTKSKNSKYWKSMGDC